MEISPIIFVVMVLTIIIFIVIVIYLANSNNSSTNYQSIDGEYDLQDSDLLITASEENLLCVTDELHAKCNCKCEEKALLYSINYNMGYDALPEIISNNESNIIDFDGQLKIDNGVFLDSFCLYGKVDGEVQTSSCI